MRGNNTLWKGKRDRSLFWYIHGLLTREAVGDILLKLYIWACQPQTDHGHLWQLPRAQQQLSQELLECRRYDLGTRCLDKRGRRLLGLTICQPPAVILFLQCFESGQNLVIRPLLKITTQACIKSQNPKSWCNYRGHMAMGAYFPHLFSWRHRVSYISRGQLLP